MKSARIFTNDFNRIVDSTKMFIDNNSNRKIYKYIRLEFDAIKEKVTAVAIDGYRLSVEHAVISHCDENFVAYIKPNVKLPAKQYAVISVDDEETKIKCGEFSFGYTLQTGEFMDWKKAIPQDDAVYKIAFNGNFLLQALQSAKSSCGGGFAKPVVLEFRNKNEPIILRTNKDDVKLVLPMRFSE